MLYFLGFLLWMSKFWNCVLEMESTWVQWYRLGVQFCTCWRWDCWCLLIADGSWECSFLLTWRIGIGFDSGGISLLLQAKGCFHLQVPSRELSAVAVLEAHWKSQRNWPNQWNRCHHYHLHSKQWDLWTRVAFENENVSNLSSHLISSRICIC